MRFLALPVSTHPRYILRPLSADDILSWANYLSLPSVYEHTSWNHPTPADLELYLGNEVDLNPETRLRLAIATRIDNLLAGTIGFHTVSPANRSAELAYDLDPKFWSQGIASSLGAELVHWAHTEVGLVRVQATVLESNTRSIATLERSAFSREGLLRSYKQVRGKPGNFYMYAHVATAE